jgi:hypothetical protein
MLWRIDAETEQAQDDDGMDIDDDGTQRAATVKDYGLKPDFDELDEEAKEVCVSSCGNV